MNISKLTGDLTAAGLKISGVSSQEEMLRIDFTPTGEAQKYGDSFYYIGKPSDSDLALCETIIAAHDPTPEPTLAEKVEALLQAAEGKPAKLDAIKAKRNE